MRQLNQTEIENISGGCFDPISISVEVGVALIVAVIAVSAKLVQMYISREK